MADENALKPDAIELPSLRVVPLGAIAVVAVLLGLHWYMQSNLPFSQLIYAEYDSRHGRKEYWLMFDIYLSMIAITLLIAILSVRYRFRWALLFSLVAVAALVGLLPVYAMIGTPPPSWPAASDAQREFLMHTYRQNCWYFAIAGGCAWMSVQSPK